MTRTNPGTQRKKESSLNLLSKKINLLLTSPSSMTNAHQKTNRNNVKSKKTGNKSALSRLISKRPKSKRQNNKQTKQIRPSKNIAQPIIRVKPTLNSSTKRQGDRRSPSLSNSQARDRWCLRMNKQNAL